MGQISMEGEMGQYFNRKTYSSFTGCRVQWVTSEGKMGHFLTSYFINKILDGEDGSPVIRKIKIGGEKGSPKDSCLR